jgi:hypothetical protein
MSDIPPDIQRALRFGLARLGRAVVSPSYIIFKIGGMVYAKNGLTGRVEFGGTDASTVIQSAVNAIRDVGGRILIKKGEYYLSRQILIQKARDIILEGEGWGTKLIATDPDMNVIKIGERLPLLYDPEELSVVKRVVVRDIFIDGSAQAGTDINTNAVNFDGRIGIEVVGNFEDIVIERCYIYNTGSDGIYMNHFGANKGNLLVANNIFDSIRGYYGGFHVHGISKHKAIVVYNQFYNLKTHAIRHGYVIVGNYIENVDFTGTYHAEYGDDYAILGSDDANIIAFNWIRGVIGGGIYYWNGDSYEGTRAIIYGNVIWNVTKKGIYAAGKTGYVGRVIISSNVIWGTGEEGIYAGYYAKGWIVSNNYIENAGTNGINADGFNEGVIEGNVIYNPSRNGDGTGSGMRIGGANLSVVGNSIIVTSEPRPSFAYSIVAGAVVNFYGGVIRSDVGFRTDVFGIGAGSVVRIRDIHGYKTQSSGVATIVAGSTRVTVSHGLVKVPSKVLVTPYANIRVWVENITDTSFDIVTDTAPTTNVNVAWYAEV